MSVCSEISMIAVRWVDHQRSLSANFLSNLASSFSSHCWISLTSHQTICWTKPQTSQSGMAHRQEEDKGSTYVLRHTDIGQNLSVNFTDNTTYSRTVEYLRASGGGWSPAHTNRIFPESGGLSVHMIVVGGRKLVSAQASHRPTTSCTRTWGGSILPAEQVVSLERVYSHSPGTFPCSFTWGRCLVA